MLNANRGNIESRTILMAMKLEPTVKAMRADLISSRSVKYMSEVLKWTIVASVAILALGLFFQATSNSDTGPMADAVKDVLPYATGLIGFGGLVTAMFGKTATPS
jgi:hypothetical protein